MAPGNRASKKFSFPLPRRLRDKPEDANANANADTRSIPSIASGPEQPSRHDESSSKAHRILGTSDGLYRSATGQTSVPASPGYISITVSDASLPSPLDDRNSPTTTTTTTENNGYLRRPDMSKKPSSNVLGRLYSGDGRRGSDYSSLSPRLYTPSSNGTLRSHYDAKNSPLAISQQTSDSAIRDRALRRGQPPVLTDHGYEIYEPSPVSPMILDEKRKKDARKSKPVRLDLSKLFPRPRDSNSHNFGGPLLSPTKMVNSPAAMSVNSGYFPRMMSRGSTSPAGPTKLQKTNTRHRDSLIRPQPSPVPSFRQDEHDSAKVNVRRPPRGVQHWFDALDEDSDESPENTQHAPTPKASGPHRASYHGSLAGQMSQTRETTLYVSQSQDLSAYKRDSFALEDIVDMTHLTSPSHHSLGTFHSQTSSKTKESVLSKINLQDSSVLSFSSSEDEGEESRSKVQTGVVRQSLDMADYVGGIVIGQAQAYEVHPHRRRPSAGGVSTFSTSTNAATIEVMYTPEPRFSPHHYSRSSTYGGGGGSKRSSHMRQPSVIHEDDDARPQTAFETPLSPSLQSVTSAHTSTSAPQSYPDRSHKLMQVTAEEEALLELMRKKRAAMNKYCSPPASVQEHDDQPTNRPEGSGQQPRTSAFLSMESVESSPVRIADAKSRQRTATGVATPPQSHSRGRSAKINVAMSQFRDSSASDTWSDRHYSPVGRDRLPHYLPPPTEFAPLDPFPQSSPTFATSVTSPNSEDNPSPLPSPITPGPRTGEPDVAVQVANSETSNELYDMTMAESGVVGAPSDSTKSDSSREFSSHRRRRTASSDAEINFPTPPTSIGFRDLTVVSAASSRAPSIVEPPVQKLPKKKAPRHISELAIASIETRSRQSSIRSTSRSSVYSQASSYQPSAGKRRSLHLSPDASFTSHPRTTSEDRDSVSDDVLAAWNSLGGTY